MLKGSDIIKKKYPKDEEKFRTYEVAVQTQIEILKRTITKFKGNVAIPAFRINGCRE